MNGLIPSTKMSAASIEPIEQMVAQALAGALSAMAGESVQVRNTPAPGVPAGDLIWFLSEFDELPAAGLLLGGLREVWLSTGRKLLTGSGVDDETALSATREMVTKGISTFASALSSKLKRGIAVKPIQELTVAPDSARFEAVTGLTIEFRDESKVTLHLFVDPKLKTLYAAERSIAATPAGFPVNTKNLDLLLDVEMPVSVSFGRAQLPLKHLIKLTTGSIVELGRSVSEPVDVIVNDTVIARGEVVVVGGNFGVRITEILSKQDRLRTLT